MSNALKNPGDHDADSVLEAGETGFLKFKRLLLILFLIVFFVQVVGVFSLYANQKKSIKMENNLKNSSHAQTLESRKAIDLSDSVSKPLSKNSAVELSYKSDQEYLAIARHERLSSAGKKPVRDDGQKVRDTVARSDKPLTLGGRGFDFKRRRLRSNSGRFVNFEYRLRQPLPQMELVPEDSLDLQLIEAKSSKDLIFHPARRAFGKYDRQGNYIKDAQPEERKTQVLENISETKLLLMEADDSFLILRRSSESLDLMSGNEKINRKKYNRW